MLPPTRRNIARDVPTKTQLKPSDRPPALPDVPDIRDLPYQPMLRPLAAMLPPPSGLAILNQGQDGACTGFGLAAVINLLIARNTTQKRRVSPHMLYRMARLYDEWPGEEYEGSSLRGALRGFFNNGVCQDALWGRTTDMFASLEAAKDARRTALGAYYRLRPVLSDYHAALNETGAIYASAAVHSGWDKPVKGVIEPKAGGPLHAFAIVGYDETGFWVQNSWGRRWGRSGVAHWSYQDWAANIQDAWVLQLAIEAPEAFGLTVRSGSTKGTTSGLDVRSTKPTRSDIAGHFVHVRNGDYASQPPYWSTQQDVEATAKLVAEKTRYRHLMIYAHGGLNAPDAAAARTAAMANVFLENGVYPYAIFYDTGLLETLKDVILGRGAAISERSGGLLDLTDRLVEQAVGGVGTRLWQEMKADATVPFETGRDGEKAIKTFVDALVDAPAPTALHLVGHSTGAILLGNLLACLDRLTGGRITVESCSLLAPACTVDFYNRLYHPRLGDKPAAGMARIRRMAVYNLDDDAEQADQVTWAYNKSLLYLVSNAFEDTSGKPLLGMKKFAARVPDGGPAFIYAAPDSRECNSPSHGGFDNDPASMNSILRRILNAEPDRPFTARDLDY